ncbi:uncharacterized protein LOC144153779 [Haemaphysalis longicornis]
MLCILFLAFQIGRGVLGDGTNLSKKWRTLDFAGNKNFVKLAERAAIEYTRDIDFFQVLHSLDTVEKKGNKHRLYFSYTPTPCSVDEPFDASKCKKIVPRAAGDCVAMYDYDGNVESATLEWVRCNDFMAPRRLRYPEDYQRKRKSLL